MPCHDGLESASKVVGLVALTLALCGCSIISDALTSGGQDRALGAAKPPTLDLRPDYESASVSADIAVPLASFSRWFARIGAPNLGSFLQGTSSVPGVTRTEPLSGGWRDPGDRRRMLFADGSSLVEQLLERKPDNIRAEMWNLNSSIGRYVAYAVEDFTLTANSSGTRIAWTVAFEPKFQPPDGWMIRSYVTRDFKEFMQTGLDNVAKQAVLDLAARSGTTKPEL